MGKAKWNDGWSFKWVFLIVQGHQPRNFNTSPGFMEKISLLTAFIVLAFSLNAQQENESSFIWGMMAGYEHQLLGIETLPNSEPDRMWAEAKRPAHGASLGAFCSWRFRQGLAIRTSLSVATMRNGVHFHPQGLQHFRFTDAELPLHFVLTNPTKKNAPLHGSLLLGARLGWNFARQNIENLRLLNERVGLDVGLGVEIKLKNWRLQPEFVYSHCVNNLHNVTNAKYDWVTGRVVRDRLSLRVLVWRE